MEGKLHHRQDFLNHWSDYRSRSAKESRRNKQTRWPLHHMNSLFWQVGGPVTTDAVWSHTPRHHGSVGSGSGLCPGSSETFLKSIAGASSVPHRCCCIPLFAVLLISALLWEQHHTVPFWLAEHGAGQVMTGPKRVSNLFYPVRYGAKSFSMV